jgi:tetratricopeptide (TPR) repeat protein
MPNEMKSAEQIMETSPDSALHILQHIQNVNAMSDGDRALYGLLYFQALDKNNKPLKPDSLITFSLNYYLKHNDNNRLANCCFYKARMHKTIQHYDDATVLYLKALDIVPDGKNDILFGKIYSDMGDICSIQMDYNESLKKYQKSIFYFNRAGDKFEATYRIITIGKVYHFQKNYKKAQEYYKQALYQTKDSLLQGFAIQEIGINYYWAKRYDSAQYFLQKSLKYPYKGLNYAVRCINLADLFFDINQYDSALHYANIALKYPSTFFNQRDCYRILANTKYKQGDFKQMGDYMTKYQACTDSVRKVETQTKSTVLENLYQTNGTASKTRKYLLLLGCIIPIIVIISLFIVYRLRNRNKGKEKRLEEAEMQISQKQSLLIESLLQKIEEARISQVTIYKKSTPAQRDEMIKAMYDNYLHVNDKVAFKRLMNRTFNNLIITLESSYPDITYKEIVWCCLFLLDVPTPEMSLILDNQLTGLYKLKQRLTQKMHLNSSKEIDVLLKTLSEIK